MPRIRRDIDSRGIKTVIYPQSSEIRREVGEKQLRPVRGRKHRIRDRISGEVIYFKFRQGRVSVFRKGKPPGRIFKMPAKLESVAIENLSAATIVGDLEEAMLKIMAPEPQISTLSENYLAFIEDMEELKKFATTHGTAFAVYAQGRRIGEIVSDYGDANEIAYKLYSETSNEDIIIQKYPNEEVELPGVLLVEDAMLAV